MEEDRMPRPRVMRPPLRRASSMAEQVHERDLELVSLKSMEFASSNAIRKLLMAGHLDYLVVGVIGGSGVGKSALLNHLCELTDGSISGCMPPFKEASLDSLVACRHTTHAVDFRVSGRRVIALDTPPMGSPSLLSDFLTSSSPSMELARGLSVAALRGSRPPKASAEALYKIMSTQVATFLLCVCHVVLFIFDSRSRKQIVELLNAAELFARSIRSSLEEPQPMADSVLVYCTKLTDSDFRQLKEHEMLEMRRTVDASLQYSESCRSGKFQMLCSEPGKSGAENGVAGAEGPSSRVIMCDVKGSANSERQGKTVVDIVALPRMKLQGKSNDAQLQTRLDEIKRQILALKHQRENTFCEATWFKRCQVVWDAIWKSKDIAEYFFTMQETLYKNGGGW